MTVSISIEKKLARWLHFHIVCLKSKDSSTFFALQNSASLIMKKSFFNARKLFILGGGSPPAIRVHTNFNILNKLFDMRHILQFILFRLVLYFYMKQCFTMRSFKGWFHPLKPLLSRFSLVVYYFLINCKSFWKFSKSDGGHKWFWIYYRRKCIFSWSIIFWSSRK